MNFDFNLDFNFSFNQNEHLDIALPIFGLPKDFKETFNNEDIKYIVLKGGRGSTKTQSAISFLIEESFNQKFKNCSFVCLREIQKTIKDSIKSSIEDIINEIILPNGVNLKDYFTFTVDSIKNDLTGVEFIFRGAKDNKGAGLQARQANADRMKGLSKVAYVFADEASALTDFTLRILIPTPRKLQFTLLNGYSTLTNDADKYKGARFIFCLNPVLAKDPVVKAVENFSNARVIHKNIFDLEDSFKSKELLAVAEQQKNSPDYDHVWLGTPSTELNLSLFTIKDFKYENIDIDELDEIAIAVDPAVTSNKDSNETGIIVAGRASDTVYIIHDLSGKYTPNMWASKVAGLYNTYKRNHIRITVVAEVNQGGDLVETTIRNQDSSIYVKQVRATKGKAIRIEPISMLYKNRKIKHIAKFDKLEEQMLLFTAQGFLGEGSPDRADAATWAITHLLLERKAEVI